MDYDRELDKLSVLEAQGLMLRDAPSSGESNCHGPVETKAVYGPAHAQMIIKKKECLDFKMVLRKGSWNSRLPSR